MRTSGNWFHRCPPSFILLILRVGWVVRQYSFNDGRTGHQLEELLLEELLPVSHKVLPLMYPTNHADSRTIKGSLG